MPTTDGGELVLTRYAELEPPVRLVLETLRLMLPAQPAAPRIGAVGGTPPPAM